MRVCFMDAMAIAVNEIKNVNGIMYFTIERSFTPGRKVNAKNTTATTVEFIPNIIESPFVKVGPLSVTRSLLLILTNP